MPSKIIQNSEHYTEVIERIRKTKKTLWIGTADIKDLHVKGKMGKAVSFLSVLDELVRKRVSIRIIHAKKPGINFTTSLSKFPLLKKQIEMTLCPRVHFKMIISDFEWAYFGSANLTGAGLGLKSENNRNFEVGMISTEDNIVDTLSSQFDQVWIGAHCYACERKKYCEHPIK